MRQSLKIWFWIFAVTGLLTTVFVAGAVSSTAGVGSATAPDAAALYNNKCAKGHGRDGRSKTARGKLTHSRDLTSGDWQNDVSDERIFNSISNGKGKMPAFKKGLSESQIDSLVTYVRRLRK